MEYLNLLVAMPDNENITKLLTLIYSDGVHTAQYHTFFNKKELKSMTADFNSIGMSLIFAQMA